MWFGQMRLTGQRCARSVEGARSSYFLSPSGCLFPVKDEGLPIVIRSTTSRTPGESVFLHSLSPSGCLFPVVCTPWLDVFRSITGRIPVECMFLQHRSTDWWFMNRSTGFAFLIRFQSISDRRTCTIKEQIVSSMAARCTMQIGEGIWRMCSK